MKIQVIGARGMLGSAVAAAVQADGHEIVGSYHGDITSCAVLGDVVINCAGIVKQRRALDSEFIMVNGFGPQRLAEACDGLGSRLIQVSTDCVFEGPGPHGESDAPNGRGIYAVSKIAGEVTRAPHLTIRTSFVGLGRRGLIAELLARRGQTVTASVNKLWTGHTAPLIARLLVALAERPDITGLLHVPAPEWTRCALVSAINAEFDLGLTVVPEDEPCDDRRLDSERWPALGLTHLPSLLAQLRELALAQTAVAP